MLRFVLLGLLVGACAPARSTTPSGETVAAEPAPSAYTFPERDRLRSALDSAPAPDRIFDADGRSDAPWTLEVTLPPLPEQAPHEAESGPGRLVTELTAARAATATDGAQCLAAALAAHVTTHGGRPSESRRGFIASRCGVVSPHIEVYGRGWSGVSDGPDAALWAQVQGEVRPWAESQVPDAPAHVGLAMARSGDQAALVLVVERPRVQLETVRPMPDDLVPSIGWESVREGIDDHRYLATLSKLIRQAAGKGLSDDANRAGRLLKELTDKIDRDGHRKRNRRGVATKLRLGGHYDRVSSRGESVPADYRRFRQRLADEILRMLSVLRG